MKIQCEPVELTARPNLWRVPSVRFGKPGAVVRKMPGLDPMNFDLQRDEDALVRAWPGQAMYCYRCKVSSDDPNPLLEEVPKFPIPLGISEQGCEHIDAVAEVIVHRCRDAEKKKH